MKQKINHLADLLATFVIYWLMGVALHEYWHANVARMLGYQARAAFGWSWGFVAFEIMPAGWHAWIIAFAGGGGVALFYVLIAHFTCDWEHDLVMRFFAPLHGVYAVFEMLWFAGLAPFIFALVIPPVAALIVAVEYMTRNEKEVKK